MLEGTASPVFLDGCTIQNTEHGTGHATHVGTITWESIETVDTCALPDAALVQGTVEIIGTSGDRLTADYRTVAVLDFAANRVAPAGLYRLSGGTGKFANAAGRGVITADGSLLPPFERLGRLQGIIEY